MTAQNRGSIFWGAVWMVVIPALLFWIPGVGGLIGGVAGGKAAGSVGRALLAWLVSIVLVTALFIGLGTLLTTATLSGMIVFSFFAGLGLYALLVVDSSMRLLGAIIGGVIA